MSGIFGVATHVSKGCAADLFYGTDYHSHLGTRRGGMAVYDDANGFTRIIHDIGNTQFRTKFDSDFKQLTGRLGIGVISDYEDQPLLIKSHLGIYAIVTVGIVQNAVELAAELHRHGVHFTEITGRGEINQTELVAMLINQGSTFEEGIARVQAAVVGSCSLLLLTPKGIYAARDQLGRTPVILGRKRGARAVTFETCALPNLGYRLEHELGPGEIVFFTPDGYEVRKQPGTKMRICSFLWVYYGYPASTYEGRNVEQARYACGAALAKKDDVKVDFVTGIPDSGTAHAHGYANAAGLPYERPFVKYTPTWPRSFMPQDQTIRELVARMKLIPIREIIKHSRMLFCEDSIVRGTQLADTVQLLYKYGAKEIHMRPACPPLLYGCKYLNFSRSRTVMELAGRKAIEQLEGKEADEATVASYVPEGCPKRQCMIQKIAERLKLTTLKYQELDDLVAAIGIGADKVCTYCWSGKE